MTAISIGLITIFVICLLCAFFLYALHVDPASSEKKYNRIIMDNMVESVRSKDILSTMFIISIRPYYYEVISSKACVITSFNNIDSFWWKIFAIFYQKSYINYVENGVVTGFVSETIQNIFVCFITRPISIFYFLLFTLPFYITDKLLENNNIEIPNKVKVTEKKLNNIY
jgi:hypothetical protein